MTNDDSNVMETSGNRAGWKQDPEGVRSNILAIALEEFSRNGLSGARMDEIAARTRTSKRMIYYYFQDKEGLYRRVLEEAYRKVRRGEEALELDHSAPQDALRQLVEFTFDHHSRNPDFIRLVMIENIHHGEYLRQSEVIRNLNAAAIARVQIIYDKGVSDGVFRPGLTSLRIHWLISALSFFNVSNQKSFSLLFGEDLFSESGQTTLRTQASETVLRYVCKDLS
ncbi:TetR/AcrR family transcriptional regulator [Rhizobium alvei]|uniref:TetR/AcrR family transcriptional regulator n=1 Tax=Rhizobium alvei TaxID=1132659 RepID=A0ABT8YTM8_9HYPH|nr:TetR/AcrR family transcriptional regulator [Rhizobium alvei]MDO6966698.1 TetR/AcrR family transcriptional regulator [Rhizobium alvei]